MELHAFADASEDAMCTPGNLHSHSKKANMIQRLLMRHVSSVNNPAKI